MSATEIAVVIGTSVAVLGALSALARFLWKKVVSFVHWSDQIARLTQQTATDAKATRDELTRNGGHSTTKDITAMAAQSAEAAAAAAVLAKQHAARTERLVERTEGSARRTEHLLRKHVENGEAIMEVGVHNDERLFEALAEADIHVTGLREYPPVYTGDDVPDPEDEHE